MFGFSSVSDFSMSSFFRRTGAGAKTNLHVSAQELASGLKHHSKLAARGDYGRVFQTDKLLKSLGRYQDAIAIASTRLETAQVSLTNIREMTHDLSLRTLAYSNGDTQHSMQIIASEADTALHSAVSTLNQSVSGSALFSGAALDRAALTDAGQILSDIEAIVTGSPDAATAMANVDFYFFDPTGGFETTIYNGSTTDQPDVSITETMTVDASVRADDPVLRTALRNLAVVASVGNGAFAAQPTEQANLLKDVGQSGLTTNDGLIKIQERLGFAQDQMARAEARNAAEEYRLMAYRNDFALADPYETTTKIQSYEAQLESIYIVTSRLQDLTLTNYIR